MSKRFTPVTDPEKARCEQNEEDLRKHRQFDTPFALLPKDLNKPKAPKEDLAPIGRPTGDMVLDENQLWRKKKELFEKKQTWGRETFEYANPEQARVDGRDNRKRRPGDVGWGTQGNFGGRGEDNGILTLQRGEVDQTMEKNEKGLWVRKKKDPAAEGSGPSEGAKELLRLHTKEDPRLEAAKPKGRECADAARKALEALTARRKQEAQVKERMGLMRRPQRREGATLNSANQVRPSTRLRKNARWQGVQRTDEEARDVVGKAIGFSNIGGGGGGPEGEVVVDPTLKRPRSPSPLALSSPSRSRSRSETPEWAKEEERQEPEGDVVVDYF